MRTDFCLNIYENMYATSSTVVQMLSDSRCNIALSAGNRQHGFCRMKVAFTVGSVLGSGIGPLDSESRDLVPDLETY